MSPDQGDEFRSPSDFPKISLTTPAFLESKAKWLQILGWDFCKFLHRINKAGEEPLVLRSAWFCHRLKALLLHTTQAKLLAVGSVLTWSNKGWLMRASIIEHSHCCSINLITSPINPQSQPVTAAELIDMPARFPVRIRQTVLAFPAQALGLCSCHQHRHHCWLPAMQLHGEISCSSSTFGEKQWDEGLQSYPSCLDLKWKELGESNL